MAKQRRYAVRSSYLPIALMAVTALGMFGVSGVLVAWAVGAFKSEATRQAADRTGQLAFPAIVRPMAAYEMVTKDDFINPRTNQLNVVWLPEATAEVASRDMSDLIGRVLSRDKQAGLVLTEADFMEKGTRPGLVAGIPPGKFAMSVEATGIPGLSQLRGGDRFDLLVSLPMQEGEDQLSNSEPAALFGGVKPPSMRVGQLSRRHGVKHLVTDGMLIALFRGEKSSTSGTAGLPTAPRANSRNAPAAETVFAELAVDPEEIGPLTEALALGTSMTCVLRSGLPGNRSNDGMSFKEMVPVITTAMPVQAFSALSDENLMDESTGQLHYYYFAPDKISKEWITDPAELYGRVVARPLRRGSFVTEADLLPRGTRPGISAGLPAGMAGMALSKANVQGFENLAIGDTFSILTRVPGDVAAPAPSTTWATLQGGQLTEDDARVAEMVRTGIREVVRDAIFLSESSGDNVVIGIPELQVAKLAQLIRDKVEVFAVARSTQQTRSEGDEASRAIFPRTPPALPGRSEPAQTLVIQNEPDNLFESPQRQGDKIAVPILAQDVPAYRALSIEDFIDPATGRPRTLLFNPQDVRADWELEVRDLIDRVVLRPMQAGRPVRSSDLAPPDSAEGPAIGLPKGMRGVVVNSRQVIGLETVSVGTPFDILSAKGLDVSGLGGNVRQTISSSDAVTEARKLPSGKIASSRVVAPGIILLADLGETTFIDEFTQIEEKEETQSSKTAEGDTITRTVTRRPVLQQDEVLVHRYILAVPEPFVGSLLGLLDLRNPLFVSLQPSSNSQQSDTRKADTRTQPLVIETLQPIRAVLQQHVRGSRIESEVFLTDRTPTSVSVASENADGVSTREAR